MSMLATRPGSDVAVRRSMRFKRILCPTDFSPGAEQGVRVAIRLARASGAELVLCHASFIPPSAYSLEAPFPPAAVEALIADARCALDRAVKDAWAEGVAATGTLLAGLPWSQLVEELTRGYDLCVVGTQGQSGLMHPVLGSVAEKVVRHAPCSVLVVRPDGRPKPFRHALVATDFSESAKAAADQAANLVEPLGEITLLHVIEMPAMAEPHVVDFTRDLDQHASGLLDQELTRIRQTTALPIKTRVRIGCPGQQILAKLTHDPSIDLVIVGNLGHTSLVQSMLGSVAEKVMRHARCPVLVARWHAA